MNPCAPFIRRPITTLLVSIGLAILGLLAFRLMPVAALPAVDFPTIMVSATLPGADPDTVAKTVTTPLERAFGRIAGLSQMSSQSSSGSSQIVLQFSLDRDIDGAARDVQAAINAARAQLPTDLSQLPTYRKMNPSAAPVLILSLTSTTLDRARLYDIASTRLQQQILQVSGVGDVNIGGGSLPAVRVELDPDRLNHYGLALETVRSALADANAISAKGSVTLGGVHYTIGANDMLHDPDDYRALVVRQDNGTIVRVADLGEVVDSVESLRNYGMANGQPAVLLIVSKQPNANVIQTVDALKAALPALNAALPGTVKLDVLLDGTQTIRASVRDVEITLLASIVLVTLVTFAFFRDWRTTLIPALAVPLSLTGTLAAMYALGYSLNNLSLMALTISTGFVVDDAIVVVENIMRHLERGKRPLQAALDGAREVGFTVMTISLSLVVVFLPLILMGGIVGRLFREFSVTLAVAIGVSLVVSLTLTPTLGRLLLCAPAPGAHRRRRRPALLRIYSRTLAWVLRRAPLMVALSVAVIGLSGWIAATMPKGFFPNQDSGRLMGGIQAPQNISFQAMQARFVDINRRILQNPDVAGVAGFVGGRNAISSSMMFITLKPIDQRRHSADQVIADLRRRTAGIPGVRLFIQSAQDLMFGGRRSNAQYQYTLRAESQDLLDTWVPKVVTALKSVPQIADVNSDQQTGSLETHFTVNRDAARRLGVQMAQVDDALYDAFGERQVSTVYESSNQYHVVMELAPRYWQDAGTLDRVYVAATAASGASDSDSSATASASAASTQSASDSTAASNVASASGASSTSASALVPLSALAQRSLRPAAVTLSHDSEFPAVTVSYNARPGVALSEADAAVARAIAGVHLPNSVIGAFSGASQASQASSGNELILVLGALVAVYIALGMLYESLLHPLTILSTLPSAGLGALLALDVFGYDLNLIALIGIVLLIGIVKKNGIMLVDVAIVNERHSRMSAAAAIHRASLRRLRPIMMTTLAAILGALPLLVGHGYGHELRQPLGVTIIGGLLFSQLITLYSTPAIYLCIDRLRRRKRATAPLHSTKH